MLPNVKRESKLDVAITSATEALNYHAAQDEEYGLILDRLVQLHKLKSAETASRVSPDTLAMIAANLIGIAMIIRHENVNVITSKAMNFVAKPK